MNATEIAIQSRPVEPLELLAPRTRRLYEFLMIAMALTVVALLLFEPPEWGESLNVGIWAVFALDYGTRLALSGDRRRFVRRNLVDLVAVLPLDAFRSARILRLARLLRLLRAGAVVWRVSATLRGVLRTNGLGWVLVTAVAVVIAGGVAMAAVEPEIGGLGDALWWSLVTATTVGYGDLSPATTAGRAIAGLLMLAGIGTIGMVTGSIATYFIDEPDHGDLDPHVAHLREQLLRWNDMTDLERRQVAALLSALTGAAPATGPS